MKKIPKHFSKEDEEADMGIGTMIVFIAMILVSAVAAGLLINTAYEVQQQAEETGKLAIKNVATAFVVLNILGDRDQGADSTLAENIEALEIKLVLASGSPDVAMQNVIIEVTTEDSEDNLMFLESSSSQHEWDGTGSNKASDIQVIKTAASDTAYTAHELRDPEDDFYDSASSDTDNPDYVVSQGAMLRVFIDLASDAELGTQDWVHIKIIPKHGVPTVFIGTTPECFTDRFVLL